MRKWPREAATPGAMTHIDCRDLVQVKRAYKFRAYPTRQQEGRAARLLADHCDLYNAALEGRREAWRMRRVSVSYGVQSAQLKEIRKADPGGQGRHSFTAQQQTLRRLNTVFKAFYQRAPAGRVGYPRFKPHSRFDQVMFVAGDGAKYPAGTSITCYACGQRCERPRQDTVICRCCGRWDADVNGARNICARAGLGSGQATQAAGEAGAFRHRSSHHEVMLEHLAAARAAAS